MANLAALNAAVFSLSAKKTYGGGVKSTPPPPVRGLKISLPFQNLTEPGSLTHQQLIYTSPTLTLAILIGTGRGLM